MLLSCYNRKIGTLRVHVSAKKRYATRIFIDIKMHVEYTMHKSNNFSFTNMVYYRVYKKVDPLECF